MSTAGNAASGKSQNSGQTFFGDIFRRIIVPEIKQTYLGVFKIFKAFAAAFGNIFSTRLFDVFYFFIVVALVAFGLAVHYSACYKTMSQAVYAVIGIVIMIFLSQVRVAVYRELSSLLMLISTAFLFLVFFAPEVNGTHRWLYFFQPSELAKITFILFLAYLMSKYKKKSEKFSSFLVFLLIVAFYGIMVLLESHLSGCILFLCIGYAMMWYNGMSKKAFLVVTIGVIAVFALVVWKPTILGFMLHDYQMERIITWKKIFFNRDLTYSEKINSARQVLQSMYGIGSGGLFGVGYGNSGQKVSNLQEKANDFIFAVLGEELGFIGSMLMIFLYGVLVFLGFRIGLRSKSYYGTLVALGISTQMALQVLINIAVATSLLPNTGISLPFFSDGGSSMVFTLASMGIMLAISKDDGKGINYVKQ